jgi:prevent-host-death family protein
MKKVAIADLKDKLSYHLRVVRDGGELLVTDRGKPLARIIPFEQGKKKSEDEILASMVNAGLLRMNFSSAKLQIVQPQTVANKNIASKYLREDRDGGQ